MTRTNRMVLTALVMGIASGVAGVARAQQQWGPPAQSKFYHNPGNPPTYMAYNTATQHAATTPSGSTTRQPAATTRYGTGSTTATARRRATASNAARRTTVRAGLTTTAANAQ